MYIRNYRNSGKFLYDCTFHFIHEVVRLVGHISNLLLYFILGMITFLIKPWVIDWKLCLLFLLLLVVSRYAAVTGAFFMLSDHLHLPNDMLNHPNVS